MPTDKRSSAERLADRVTHSEAAVDAYHLPLSLRIVAYAFILFGTLRIVEMLIDWFVFNWTSFDIFFLTIFVGLGLQKWRESSRGWAVFLTWLGLFFISTWLPMASCVILGVPLPFGSGVGGATVPGVLAGVCILGYLIWQLRVFRRPDIVTRFRTLPLRQMLEQSEIVQSRQRRRWQFSLGSLLLIMIVAAFVLARLTADNVLYDMSHPSMSMNSGSTVRHAHYGVQTSRFGMQRDTLAYVVLRIGKEGASIRSSGSIGEKRNRLKLPSGDEIELPSEHQLHEFSEGKLCTRPERVTLEEFESFMNANPTKWNLDALVKHAEQMRAKQED